MRGGRAPLCVLLAQIEHTLDTSTSASARSGSRVKWISPSSSGTVPNNMAIDFDGSLLVVGRVESAGLQTFGSGPGAAVVNFGTCSSTGHCVYLEKASTPDAVCCRALPGPPQLLRRRTECCEVVLG